MIDQNTGHPILGRRRRHKSPPLVQNMSALPVPRLADHLDIEIAPSDEEGGKEAKRQKSEPTTPISTSSRPPNEYDEVMGITQVDSREAERFEEGLESEYHDASEESPGIPNNVPNLGHMPCFSHGGCGSSSLQECLNLLSRPKSNSLAPCHSGVASDKPPNPPQVMSPNVEEEQTYGRGQASGSLPEGQLLPNDEPQSRTKEEIKDEEVTPKLEKAAVETKEEPNEQDVGDQDSDALRDELQSIMILRIPLAQSGLLMSLEDSPRNTRKLRDLLHHVNPGEEPQLHM